MIIEKILYLEIRCFLSSVRTLSLSVITSMAISITVTFSFGETYKTRRKEILQIPNYQE